MKFVSASDKSLNTIHPNNIEFYRHLNEIVQYEPLGWLDAETRGLFASIGIEKGGESRHRRSHEEDPRRRSRSGQRRLAFHRLVSSLPNEGRSAPREPSN